MSNVPILMTSPGIGVSIVTADIPADASAVHTIDFTWWDLPAGSIIRLWTQTGPTANAPSNAANLMLTQFEMQAATVKTRQYDRETLCMPIPDNHDLIVAEFTNPEPASKAWEANIAFGA